MTAAKTVFEAFLAVQGDIGSISKDKRVTEGPARFLFRGVDDVMTALHGPMTKHGLICVPVVQERIGETRRSNADKAINVVHLRVRFDFYGPDGSTFSAEAWGEGQDSSDKATGKAHSMAYKSALLEAFHVPTEDTPDADYDTTPAAPPAAVTDRTWLADFDARLTMAGTTDAIRALWPEAVAKRRAHQVDDPDWELLEKAMKGRADELAGVPS